MHGDRMRCDAYHFIERLCIAAGLQSTWPSVPRLRSEAWFDHLPVLPLLLSAPRLGSSYD